MKKLNFMIVSYSSCNKEERLYGMLILICKNIFWYRKKRVMKVWILSTSNIPGLLEKVYIRHIEDSENVAKKSIDAGTSTFKAMVLAPLQFLLQYFNISTGIGLDQSQMEKDARDDVDQAESDVNDPEKNEDDVGSVDETDNNPEGSDDESGKENDTRLVIA